VTTLVMRHAARLQDRICGTPYALEATVARIYEQLRQALDGGFYHDQLRTPPHQIRRLLKLYSSHGTKRREQTHEIVGGPRVKDFSRRLSASELFERHDGALFNFTVTVGQGKETLALLAYDFELRFPESHVEAHGAPRFIRFDLNLPGHDNASRGLRCHLHPGHDDLQAPSALMTPIEIIELFLYGLGLPDTPRSK
jgi:hypothetical protein